MKVLHVEKDFFYINYIRQFIVNSKHGLLKESELVNKSSIQELVLERENKFDVALFGASSINKDCECQLKDFFVSVPSIFLTDKANIDLNYNLNLIKKGMQDCIDINDANLEELEYTILSAFERGRYLRRIRNLNQKLKDESNRDLLTSLYNRRGLSENFSRLNKLNTRSIYPMTALLFDCDNFKKINDNYGYNAGDKVLEGIAVFLKKSLRETDIIARVGGDEFVVILPGTNISNGYRLCEELRRELSLNMVYNNIKLTVSGTVFELEACNDGNFLERILRISSEGIKYCKNNGKNRFRKIICVNGFKELSIFLSKRREWALQARRSLVGKTVVNSYFCIILEIFLQTLWQTY